MSNQGKRDQEGNPGRDAGNPAGTSGRPGDSGTQNWQQGHTDTNRPAPRPRRIDDEEDSGLGNRTTFR